MNAILELVMPKSCSTCSQKNTCSEYIVNHSMAITYDILHIFDKDTEKERLPNCPLKPITPNKYKQLLDKVELKMICYKKHNEYYYSINNTCERISTELYNILKDLKSIDEKIKKELTPQKMISTIKNNYPPKRYSMLRETLDYCIKLLENQTKDK